MTPTKIETDGPSPALPFTFGGLTIPAGCRRLFITAELESANGDPRIQPTGFPDLGPVMYADPSEKHGLICLIESEASMANRLEETCLGNKFEGTFRNELKNLPYIKLTKDGTSNGELITASTIDGHRFASEYIMGGHIISPGPELDAIKSIKLDEAKAPSKKALSGTKAANKKTASNSPDAGKEPATGKPEFVRFVQSFMGMTSKDRCPASNVPRIFRLAMEYDPMSLLHGFQVSVKDKLTFVGLRSARVITGSVLGLNCQRITVPGVRFDAIGTGDAGQAIFQKQRVSAKKIEARFSIDVGMLTSMELGNCPTENVSRLHLLLAIALCKIAWFLSASESGLRLRTDCDLRISAVGASYWIDRTGETGQKFDFIAVKDDANKLAEMIANAGFNSGRSPLFLKHVAKKKEDATKANQDPDPLEESDPGDNQGGESTEGELTDEE